MLNFGFSEAELYIGRDSVLKITPQGREQAEYMKSLGPYVCPRVYSVNRDGYVMEKLRQPNPKELFNPSTIIGVHKLLREKVHPYVGYHKDWKVPLKQFLETYQDILPIDAEIIDHLYPEKVRVDRIHGDCTLANVMYRGDQLLLIDPVKPRGKIPYLKEVDYGKMLQSALGWEGIQQKIPYKSEHLIPFVLDEVEEVRKAWFWGLVNIIRILPRAQKRPDVVKWCHQQVRQYWKEVL